MKIISTHYIDGAFVESHGREVMDIVSPTNAKVIARVTLADEEDTRHAIAAARQAFATFGRTTKEERTKILRRLHEVVSARVDDLTAVMVEEYIRQCLADGDEEAIRELSRDFPGHPLIRDARTRVPRSPAEH